LALWSVHQRDQRVLIEVVGVLDQSGVVEEIRQRFAALGPFRHGVYELVQLSARAVSSSSRDSWSMSR